METSVKWNLDEATEISVLSGMDVIKFAKNPKNQWGYRVQEWTDYGLCSKTEIKFVEHADLPALLEKYEAAGCGVLVAAPKKVEPLKLGSKMVEVSTNEFDWEDVETVNVYREGRKAIVFKFEGDEHGDYVEGECVFARIFIDSSGLRTRNSYMWDAQEIEEEMFHSTTEMYEIYNHDGELMQHK